VKSVHLKKIASRIDRLTFHFGDEARVWRMLVRTVPHILPRDASNRANDLTRVLNDVPELIATIHALREERTALRGVIHEMHIQLESTVTEAHDSKTEDLGDDDGLGS
jgi:hypothetical protein